MGIEPTSRAWEAFVLPLNYTRLSKRCQLNVLLKLYTHIAAISESILPLTCCSRHYEFTPRKKTPRQRRDSMHMTATYRSTSR